MGEFESEEARRAEALRLVTEEGWSVTAAAAVIGRSRRWLSKWAARFNAGEGLSERSRASSTSFQSSSGELVDVVLEYRRRLETDPVSSVGGLSILAAMERDGLTGLPSVRSIERILTRAGMTHPKTKKTSRSTVPILPLPQVGHLPGVWHQSDWIQDRYLEGGIRYNSIQLVDMGSGGGIARQYRHRSMTSVAEFWTLFVRLCLFFGTEPVISPPRELGWTNGAENFNNLFQDRTIAKRRYSTLELLAGDTDLFNHWANHLRPLHPPAVAGTRYPDVLVDNFRDTLRWPPSLFLANHQDSKGRLRIPLTDGRVTFLRRVHQQAITIAQHRWPIDLPDHRLVVASITTRDATLTLRHQTETLATHTYPIPHPVTNPYYPPHPHSIYHHAQMRTMP
ncbi:MAG: helix-turn-helix domain-containing protein [Acidimicrobiia bacterium]|nr:helix-turn-helix domain-containing protein [Acidimicrobiia bacterium]